MTTPPDLVEEIVGWRAWIVRLRELRTPILYSVTRREWVAWPADRWTVAECAKDHDPPGEKCSCGIYAARDRDQLDGLGYADGAILHVIGEVGLAGRVVVGTQGWRAEKARPRRLLVPHDHWQLVELFERAYSIPVELGWTLPPQEIAV